MLTGEEVNRIFSWQPYRPDWTVDRNQVNDSITSYYGKLIDSLTRNDLFTAYYSEDGSMGNYLEFFCYPKRYPVYRGNAILVCVSLCAPVAAYGQTTFSEGVDHVGWGEMFSAEKTGEITDPALAAIEAEIRTILLRQHLSLLDAEFASRQLPDEVAGALRYENHNTGSQYLHGIFQKTD